MEAIFQALASQARRKILAYLAGGEMNASEIAARFEMTKPSLSKHLSLLESAGLIAGDKRGQYIYYSLVQTNLINTLDGFLQEVCPVRRPIKKESLKRAKEK